MSKKRSINFISSCHDINTMFKLGDALESDLARQYYTKRGKGKNIML